MNCVVCGVMVPMKDRGDGVLIPASKYWFRVPDTVFCSVEHCHEFWKKEEKDATQER